MQLKDLISVLRDAEIINLAIFEDSDYVGTTPALNMRLKPYFDREVMAIQFLSKPEAGSIDANLVVVLGADKDVDDRVCPAADI